MGLTQSRLCWEQAGKSLYTGTEVNLIQGDMVDSSLDKFVDFVYVLLGSLFVKSTRELIGHFNSVARY